MKVTLQLMTILLRNYITIFDNFMFYKLLNVRITPLLNIRSLELNFLI